MQVQKINNSQLFVKNKSNNNACDRESLHNVSFGAYGEDLIERLIRNQGKNSHIGKLLGGHHVNHNHVNHNPKSPIFQLLNFDFKTIEYVHHFFVPRCQEQSNIFIGSSLYKPFRYYYTTWEGLRIAKQAGIKTIIDLDSEPVPDTSFTYQEYVEDSGLRYFSYPIRDYFINETHTDEEIKNKLVDFIKEIQKDNIYIGSELSYYRDIVAMINNWFNPKPCSVAKILSFEMIDNVHDFVRRIYPLITAKDEESMGWSQEFKQRCDEKFKSCKY